MKSPGRNALAVGLATGLVVAFAWRGSFLSMMAVIFAAIWIAFPAALVWGALSFLHGLRPSTLAARGVLVCRVLFLMTIAPLVALPLGRIAHDFEIRYTKRFVDGLIPDVEAFHAINGRYPETLTELDDDISPPRLLLGHKGGYRRNGSGYRIWFTDESTLMGAWDYDSFEGGWIYSD